MTNADVSQIEHALYLDSCDPLREFRNEFDIADQNTIYLDGNSLGRRPLKILDSLNHVIKHEWGNRLIRSWNENWIKRSTEVAEQLAVLVGAQADEILVADSTSVNLFKLAIAAIKSESERKKIISDTLNFPSDLYIIQGIQELLDSGYHIELVPTEDDIQLDENNLISVLDRSTAFVTLSLVSFKSAYLYDLRSITKHVHECGAVICWDLSHATGAVPIDLNGSDVDMAIGCTYKYLNGGPGSPAFIYIRKDLQDKYTSPVWGWFGAQNPFRFDLEYSPATGIQRFSAGTPPILSLSTLSPALEIINRAGMERIRKKSSDQTELLIKLYDLWLKPLGFSLGSPREIERRGSHISIRHNEGYRICQALIHPKDCDLVVIPDFRNPDYIRLGIAPLYTSFEDIFRAMDRIRTIMEREIFMRYSPKPLGVT